MSGFYLRQATASQTRLIGPFVDDTDFKTAETGLTIANTDIKLSINGGASANKNSGGGTHIVNGEYAITLDATDTATVGELTISVSVSGALIVKKTFWVLEEAIYDALFAASATGLLPANVTQISGDSGAADNLELAYDGTGYDVGGIDVSELNQIVDDLLNGGRLDLLVNAIKERTDNLAFTTAGKVDARVDYVGTNAVTSPDDFKATSVIVSDKAGFSLAADQSGVTIGTVNAMAGTITTLDALDAAQDSQHSTTQSAISTAQSDLDTLTGSDGATISTASATAIGTAFLATALSKGTAGTIERAFWQILKTQAVTDGTAVADASNTTTTFYTDLTAADSVYDHMIILFTSNGLEGEARPIDTYVQTNGVITLQEALTTAPTGDEEFIILPQHAHPISEIQDGLATSANQTTILNRLGAFTGTGVNTVLGFFKAMFRNDASLPSDIGGTYAASTMSLEANKAEHDATQIAVASIEGAEGTGANSITPTVTDGTDLLESAKVRFTKGSETYLQSTNSSGTFSTPFALDNGTWTVAITLPGYTFATTTLVVTGNATPTYAMTATGLSVPESPRIRARLLVLDKTTKEGKSGVELQVTVTDAAFADGYASEATTITVTSDANGLAEWYALPGESYKITGENVSSTVTVPKTATDPHSVKSVLV